MSLSPQQATKVMTLSFGPTNNSGSCCECWRQLSPYDCRASRSVQRCSQGNALYYIKEAIKSDRTTLIGELEKQGQSEMANIIRRL